MNNKNKDFKNWFIKDARKHPEKPLKFIKDFLEDAKKHPEYDKKKLEEIKRFMDDTTPESLYELVLKCCEMGLDSLVKENLVKKIGQDYSITEKGIEKMKAIENEE